MPRRTREAMAELTQKDRLQPSLLDRLTDDEPDKLQESREKRI
jgi:type VI secretion system protein ImpF